MAYATPRSCNSELYEGATDGAQSKPRDQRGGIVTSPSNLYPGNVMNGVITRHWPGESAGDDYAC